MFDKWMLLENTELQKKTHQYLHNLNSSNWTRHGQHGGHCRNLQIPPISFTRIPDLQELSHAVFVSMIKHHGMNLLCSKDIYPNGKSAWRTKHTFLEWLECDFHLFLHKQHSFNFNPKVASTIKEINLRLGLFYSWLDGILNFRVIGLLKCFPPVCVIPVSLVPLESPHFPCLGEVSIPQQKDIKLPTLSWTPISNLFTCRTQS